MDETAIESQPEIPVTNTTGKHELNPDLVRSWSKQHQPVWRTIESLQARSRFKRESAGQFETTIEHAGQKYQIEKIKDPQGEDVKKAYDLLRSTFKPEELDPLENIEAAAQTHQELGDGYTTYIYLIKDSKGEIANLLKGNNIVMKDAQGKRLDKTVFMIDYSVTPPDRRQTGLAREAYISALMDISSESEANGKTLAFATGEAVSTAETFWNRVGWKRAYVQAGTDKTHYEEVVYVQPPMGFDPDTGEIAPGAGNSPEHFMIDGFGVHTPSKQEVDQAIKGMYSIYKLDRESFNNDAAYQRHLDHLSGLINRSEQFLNSHGQVIFLDGKSREHGRTQSLTIADFTEADEALVHTGPEDM